MKNKKVTIIDYGVGNLLSLKRAFEKVDGQVIITNEFKKIINSSYIVLPGVGAFGNAMKSINQFNLIEPLKIISDKEIPLLGICLGAQLLLSQSEELGLNKGIDIIKGKVESINQFKIEKNIKIPHIGWNIINKGLCKNNFLKQNYFSHQYYFIHSYYCDPKIKSQICSYTPYGKINFCSSIRKENIFGTQFHPEKSSLKGLEILKNIWKLT